MKMLMKQAGTQAVIRPAQMEEYEALENLIAESARGLGVGFYSDLQTEAAITHIFGVDSELVSDGTYFTVEFAGRLVACGGWSRRRTLFGGDRYAQRESGLLDPKTEAARIRAFFVHPDFARQGIGTLLLQHCEAQARAHGFTRLEMMATLPGVPFYAAHGYEPGEETLHKTPDSVALRMIPMTKTI